MPLRIIRPEKPLESLARAMGTKSRECTSDLASLAQDTLRAYTPNKWKGLLYKAVENRAKIPGGEGVGGPIGGLLPEPRPSPRGVIAQFLQAHPKFVTRSRVLRGQEASRHVVKYIPRGRSFPLAWQHLPPEARELLRDERLAGMYQSGAPAAPYWLIAEQGMPRVGVPARYNIRNSQAAVERAIPLVRRRTLDTL